MKTKKAHCLSTMNLYLERVGALKTAFDASACQVKRKESRRELHLDSVWWLRELDLNQRPSGYRAAPVAVPEICCLQSAAPDFDRSPSSSSLVLPQAAVGLVTQRATFVGMKKDSPFVDDESILGKGEHFGNGFQRERLAGLKEKSPDAICVQTPSGGCGSWI